MAADASSRPDERARAGAHRHRRFSGRGVRHPGRGCTPHGVPHGGTIGEHRRWWNGWQAMPKDTPNPILVGYDTRTGDLGPVRFALSAARFTGAPLVVGSVHADHGHAHLEHGLQEAGGGLPDGLAQELDDGVTVDYRMIAGASA